MTFAISKRVFETLTPRVFGRWRILFSLHTCGIGVWGVVGAGGFGKRVSWEGERPTVNINPWGGHL